MIDLFHRRWAAAILAFLWGDLDEGGQGGAKFITMHQTLGVNRESLTDTLDHLIDLGYVRRNTGYGHPMRPEYVLTARGRRTALSCRKLIAAAKAANATDLLGRKWSVPVLFTIGPKAVRFSDLVEAIPDQTNRALAISLKQLEAAALLTREVTADFPPTVWYRLTSTGSRLTRLVADI